MIYQSRDDVERIGRAGASRIGDRGRFLSSFWLYLEPDDTAFTPHWMEGYWESWITKWFSEQLTDHDMFIDVGANVGYYTYMAASTGIDTISVEPNPEVYKLLISANGINGFRGSLSFRNIALSNKSGTVSLYVPQGHSGAGTMAGEIEGAGQVEVKCDTLDSLGISPRGRDILIKIDAEGAEPLIWEGMKNTLKSNNVTTFLEWAPSRYENAGEFADKLMAGNKVTLINYQGFEEPISKQHLLGVQDWVTIVVRNYN